METSVSGFKVTGSWDEIVEHGEKIESILETIEERESYEIETELIEEFNEWRPKIRDVGDESEISERTAEKASIEENTAEREDKGVADDIETAADKAGESMNELSNKNMEKSWMYWRSTTNHVTRATNTLGRKIFRRIEKFVYSHLMTVVSPYYFDNVLVSANIARKSEDTYEFEININDDELKNHVEDVMLDLDDKNRWHLQHEDAEEKISVSETDTDPDTIENTPSMESEHIKQEISDSYKESKEK